MVLQMESFSGSEGDDGTHPLQPQQSLKRKSNQTPPLLGFCQLQMLALKQTGLLSIFFAYFVPIIFIVIAIRIAVVLFKIIETLAFILCCFALPIFHLLSL
ncbi:hypothetical protein RGQ29_024343 [Quercus rubra]|uniref:Uncharacterized protein n=1 Tax=Quercus rubra TaxID=3512 RepID=A0AAN7IND4_QUERU|nr:hypothetical protein RGQ29_024343 [Quercus rubra]